MDRKIARTLHSLVLEVSETIADVRDAEDLAAASRQAMIAIAMLRALEMMLEPYLSNAPQQQQRRDPPEMGTNPDYGGPVPDRPRREPHPQEEIAAQVGQTIVGRGLYSRYGPGRKHEDDIPEKSD